LKYLGKTWTQPEYTKEEPVPFIPTETEIDSLVASAWTPKTATLLQLLKETGARIGEIDKLKWTHIDQERRTIYITAEKGSNSRILPISAKLVSMFNNLPKVKRARANKHGHSTTFDHLRNQASIKLNNPRLKQIHLHTFRHWKGTMEYHKTKDIIHVKQVLGHKSIDSTMLYINIEQALYLEESDEFTCKATKDTNEATKLIESGFQYVTTTPEGLMLFKKRK
jgi:integrase